MNKIKKTAAVLLIAAMTVILPACGAPADSELAKVNDTSISSSDVDQYLPLYGLTAGIDVTLITDEVQVAALREAALKDLVDMEVIRQYLDSNGTDVVPETRDDEFQAFKAQVDSDEETKTFMKNNNISEEYLEEFFDNQYYTEAFYAEMMSEITDLDAQTQTYYDGHLDEFTQDQVKASHILVTTREEAETILEDLEGGADFATIAGEKSIDTTSAVNGGDLGYFAREQMVPTFAEAAFTTEIGQMSGIVQSDYGFHIIKVADKRTYTQTFEEAQQTIMYTILQSAYKEKIDGIRAAMKVEFSE